MQVKDALQNSPPPRTCSTDTIGPPLKSVNSTGVLSPGTGKADHDAPPSAIVVDACHDLFLAGKLGITKFTALCYRGYLLPAQG